MNRALGHLCALIGQTGPGEPPEDGLKWHCPSDQGFEIRVLAVWGRARYLSVTEAPHNTDFHTWMGKKHFCFFQTAETGNQTPNSGVKGSGANHYPRAMCYARTIENIESRSPGKIRDHDPKRRHCWATVLDAGRHQQKKPWPNVDPKLAHRLRRWPNVAPAQAQSLHSKHENVQPMSVQCCPIVFDAGPTLHQHRPHASRPPGYAHTGPTNSAT